MKSNLFLGLLAMAVVAISCASEKHYKISGTVEGGDGMVVYLQKQIGEKEFLVEDSVRLNGEKFVLTGKIEQMDKRVLKIGNTETALFLDDVPMEVTATFTKDKGGNKTTNYKVELKGSPEQDVLAEWKSLEMGKAFMSLGGMFAMAQVKDDSVKLDSTYKAIELIKQELDKKIKHFVDSNSNRVVITYMISEFIARDYPFDYVESAYANLTPEVKASYGGQLLKEKIEKLKSINVGGIAPDINLASPDGNMIKLSSLRGKYVLLDFWASWCGPCLAEVPNVKAIYDKYKDKGFEIYGVSLDNKEDAWKDAIEKHGLTWLHVSSLKGWECPVAKQYNVTGIPKMFLLDPEGRIVAMDLRGEELKAKVASFFE